MEMKVEIPENSPIAFSKQKLGASCRLSGDNELIDCTKFNFHDDETWLYDSSSRPQGDIQHWLYSSDGDSKPATKLNPKNIDTRTFTRPKKRFTRPSIEKYNEELYGCELKELTDSGIQINGWSQNDAVQPLHFDLDQPSTSVYFENIFANSTMMDSFQNMSPPSLVNSMCSSTFANLMESSFIKNDPVLREIRDTDFTGSILQQEAEPMFHSITESFSSLNSDVPENFLKKVSFTEEHSKSQENEAEITVVLNGTFAKDDAICDETVIIGNCNDLSEEDTATHDLNTTYTPLSVSPNPKPDRTLVTNSTFQRRKSPKLSATVIVEKPRDQGCNSTITVETNRNHMVENTKRLLDRRPSPSYDLNRLNYVERNELVNATFTNESPKRNSFGSTDSGENLDYMSISSASSRSSKMQSVDELSDIVDFHEQNFQRVMSTPSSKSAALWPNHEISPITDCNSDPELSSCEQSPKQNAIRKQRSVGHINKKMPLPKCYNTLSQLGAKGPIRGSQPNLRLSETRTYGPQRSSNLNSMGHALKGSYTSLKPTNPNLPVAPPPLDATVTIAAQVAESKSEEAQFVRPQPMRSGLPRPSTGIPRPVSRIPGPRKVR